MRFSTLFSIRSAVTLALAAFLHPAFGHGMDEETFSLFFRMQSNRLPALLAAYCTDSAGATRARAEALTATVLSSPLSVEDICGGQCQDGDANTVSRAHVEAFIAEPEAAKPDEASCKVLLTWLDSVQGRFGKPLGDLLRQSRTDVPETIHALSPVTGDVWRSDGSNRAIASLNGHSLKIQVDYEGVPLDVRAMGDAMGIPAKEMPVGPYAFTVWFENCGQCNTSAAPGGCKGAAAPVFEQAVLRVRGKRFAPVESRRQAEPSSMQPRVLVTFAPTGILGTEPLELEIGPFRDGNTVFPPLVLRTEAKPAGLLRMPSVFFELSQLLGRGKPALPLPAQQWQARQAQTNKERP